MEELFVTYELALLARKKGFRDECLAYYRRPNMLLPFPQERNEPISGHYISLDNRLCAPLYQQLQDWLLTKGIYAEPSLTTIYNDKYGYRYGRLSGSVSGYTPDFEGNTRKDALIIALKSGLALL